MRDPVDPEGKSSQRHVQIRWLLDWMIMILYVMYIYIYDNMYCIGYLVIGFIGSYSFPTYIDWKSDFSNRWASAQFGAQGGSCNTQQVLQKIVRLTRHVRGGCC